MPHVALPIPQLGVPDFSSFRPALIPEEARPMVLAPISVVRFFVAGLCLAVMGVVAIVAVIFSAIPFHIVTLGLVSKLSLILVCILVFVALILSIDKKKNELGEQLLNLERMAAGDFGTATAVAMGIAEESAKGGTGMAAGVADWMIDVDASAAASRTLESAADSAILAAKAARDAAPANAKANTDAAGEAVHILSSPVYASGSISSTSGNVFRGATNSAGDTVKAAMELSPLFAFEQTVKLVMKAMLYVVIATPIVLYAVGYLLWKFGIQLSGGELMLLGVALGLAAPILWIVTRKRALSQLEQAGSVIIDIQKAKLKASAMEQFDNRAKEDTPLFGFLRIPNPLHIFKPRGGNKV